MIRSVGATASTRGDGAPRAIATSASRSSEVCVGVERGVVRAFDARCAGKAAEAWRIDATMIHDDVDDVSATVDDDDDDDDDVNAVCYGDCNYVFFASGRRVFEADVRAVSGSGERGTTRRLGAHADSVNGLAFLDAQSSSRGAVLAACDDDGDVVIYDVSAPGLGRVTRRMKHVVGGAGCATAAAFRRKRGGARELLTSATDCTVKKWDIDGKSVPVGSWDVRAMESVRDVAARRRLRRREAETASDASARSFNPPMAHSVACYAGEVCEDAVPGVRRIAVTACGDGSVVVFDADAHGGGGGKSKHKKSAAASSTPFGHRDAQCVRLGDISAESALSPSCTRHTNAATCADFVPWNARGAVVISGGVDRKLIAWDWTAAARRAAADDDDDDDTTTKPTDAIAHVACARKINGFAFDAGARPGTVYVIDTGCVVKSYVID